MKKFSVMTLDLILISAEKLINIIMYEMCKILF